MKYFTYPKKACFQVSSEMDIFINETISKWQSKLKINSCVYWTTDFNFYNEIHKIFTEKPINSNHVAECLSGLNLMYLSKVSHQFSYKQLEASIVHELLHMKNPNKSEKWIVKKTEELCR